jgi:Ca2+-binding RTX toxin-like protein
LRLAVFGDLVVMNSCSKFEISCSALTKGLTRTAFVWACTFSVLLNVPAGAQLAPAGAQPLVEESAATDLAYARGDLDYILEQVKIAEEHVQRGGGCETLRELIPSALLPWGLRTVDGSCNNLLPDKGQLGAADEVFREVVEPQYDDAQILSNLPLSENDTVGARTSYKRGDGSTVEDSQPRLISRLITNNSTSNPAARAAAAAAEEIGAMEIGPDITGVNQYFIPNAAPDEGLSAPTNAWMTFFGQFFDHGLDLVEKGGNGVVLIPLAEDDPLFSDEIDAMNFQLLTRSSRDAGPDGWIGTADDVASPINRVTNHVDQQQTYSGHSSAQVLLREYTLAPCLPESQPAGQTSCLVPTGGLLNGFGNDRVLDTEDDGGLATWNAVKTQALLKFGIALDDLDGADQPMFLANQYGAFIPGPDRGLPQLIVGHDENGTPQLVEGNVSDPVDASRAMRIHHSVFIDISHTANPGKFVASGIDPEFQPDSDNVINQRTDMLAGQETRGVRAPGMQIDGIATYDDELLGEHYICGDGRCNENIALTTIHTIFHREHNRLAFNAKRSILDTGDLAFINQWMSSNAQITQEQLNTWSGLPFAIGDASLSNQATAKASIKALGFGWNGERIFQTARFATEMQYNRIVFDEFSPTLSALKDGFVFTNQNSIDPRITAEFAHSVYRFGHSMLTEKVDRFDENFDPIVDPSSVNPETADDQLGLFEAFLNPTAFLNYDDSTGMNTLSPEEASGAILRGVTRQVSSEIDEFVTGALQNNLLGMPLDLPALNIARARESGVPRLNPARRMFYKETGDTALAPYKSWVDYADNLRHDLSLVNFVAAYGTHPLVAGADLIAGNNSPGEPGPIEDRREAACQLVSSIALDPAFCEASGFVAAGTEIVVPDDAEDFMRSQGAWAPGANGFPISGMEEVDFWVGGIAEEKRPFQGYLGSTHNFVFESQMEALQNADRLYYLHRTAGIPMLASLESNSFSSLVMRNSDLGKVGGGSLSAGLFMAPHHYLEVIADNQVDPDPEPEEAFFDLVIRDSNDSTSDIAVAENALFLQYTGGDHVVIGGSIGPDTMIGGIGDDSIWGRAGDDRIEGGDGADHIEGGSGNDIITDLSGPDVIEGGEGHDAINAGNGPEDFIFGDNGSDFLVNPYDFAELFGGPGNDFLYDGWTIGHHRGGAGDDWIENRGSGEEIMQGDFGMAPEFGVSPEKGHDVIINLDGNADIDMENGDDIAIDGPGMDIFEGSFGFDWASFTNDAYGVEVDFDLRLSLLPVFPPSPSNYQNRFAEVEGLSGSSHSDLLRGTDNLPGMAAGNEMSIVTDANGTVTENGFELIEGLNSTDDGRFGLVPEGERRDLSPDNVTGESQFGWMGEIILGGGSSDLLVGEGGMDILDGDSALDVAISTPDPMFRTGEANLNMMLAEVSVNATTANMAMTSLNVTYARVIKALADENVVTVEGSLSAVQAAAIAARQESQTALDAAIARMGEVSDEAVAVNVEFNSRAGGVTLANQAVLAAVAMKDTALMNLAAAGEIVSTYREASADLGSEISDANAAYVVGMSNLEDLNAQVTTSTNAVMEVLGVCAAAPEPGCLAASNDAQDAMISAFNARSIVQTQTDAAQAQVAAGVAALEDADEAYGAAVVSSGMSLQNYEDAKVAVMEAEDRLNTAINHRDDYEAVHVAANVARVESQNAEMMARALNLEAEEAAGEANVAMETALHNQEVATSALAVLVSDMELMTLADAQANAALVEAMANMPEGEESRILVKSMMDVQEAVFMGAIIPNELSIWRAINDHDPDDVGFDAVQYTGNREDYSIESSPGDNGILGDADDEIGDFFSWNAVTSEIMEIPDGFIEIIDNRVGMGLGPDGRDLVRNIERLIFDDQVVDIRSGAAGASLNTTNTPAQGRITVTPAVAVVGDTLVASMAGVTDADGILEDTIAFRWTVELAVGSGVFEPLVRVGAAGFGDEFVPNGPVLDVHIAEAGLQIRVEVLFSDAAGAFEFARSDALLVGCPVAGCPAAAGVMVPATFAGTPADVQETIIAANTGAMAVPFVENASAAGSPRLDFGVSGLPRAMFLDTGFLDTITQADAVPLTGVSLELSDSTGVVTGRFTPDVGARVDALTGLVDQEMLDITFSLRDAGLMAAVTAPYTTISLIVNGEAVANAILYGDPSVDSGQNLAVVLINQSPPLNGAANALMTGTATDLVEPPEFVNHSVPDGNFRAFFTLPSVEVTALNIPFGTDITAAEEAYVAEGLTLRFEEAMAMAPMTQARTKDIYRPVVQAHVEDGVVSQSLVDLVFEIEREMESDLISGLTYAILENPGLGSGEVGRWTFFGDSAAAPQDVIVLTSAIQMTAASELIRAMEAGVAQGILDATQLMLQSNLTQSILTTQNQPGGPAALLAESGVPHANFVGVPGAISGPLEFENASRLGQARLEFSVSGVSLSEFVEHGFSVPMVGTDVSLVDRISLYVFSDFGLVKGIYLAEIVPQVDALTGLVSTDLVNLVWDFRGDAATPLVSGLTVFSVVVDGVERSSIMLSGDSMNNDAQGVVQVEGPSMASAQTLLANVFIGDLSAAEAASFNLTQVLTNDLDPDGDGVFGSLDTCPMDPNNDIDGDGVCGDVDNCAMTMNALQVDDDNDGLGNACDNCDYVANSPTSLDPGGMSQRDSDNDGHGNMCDADLDNDGMVDFRDFAMFQASFGMAEGANAAADMSGDGMCNFQDLAIFQQYFEKPAGADVR